MHLRKQKKPDGRVYLSIVQSYRTPEGKTRSKTIRSLGYLDALENDFDDPVAHFQAEIEQLNQKRQNADEPATISFPPSARIPLGHARRIEAGAAICSAYFHRNLGLGAFFQQAIARKQCPAIAARVFELLVWSRIAHPQNFEHAREASAAFPGLGPVLANDFYLSIKQLVPLDQSLVAWVNTTLANSKSHRPGAPAFCLVGNHFVETSKIIRQHTRTAWDKRPSPLVQLAILVDEHGCPLDYEVFEGTLSDQLSLLPAARKLKKRHKDKRFVVVAGKSVGSNCNELVNWIDNGMGFVFAQSLRKGTRFTRDWVLDSSGYQANGSRRFATKERVVKRSADPGRGRPRDIDVKEVAYWQHSSYEKSNFERFSVIKRNEDTYAHGAPASGSSNPVRAVRGQGEARPGDVGEHVWRVYWEKIAQDETSDGFHALVSTERDVDAETTCSIFHNMQYAQDMFHTQPGEWSACPDYLSREEYLRLHFLVCFVSSCILQLLYQDVGADCTDDTIQNALVQLTGQELADNQFFFGYRSKTSDALATAAGIDLARPVLTLAQLLDIMKQVRH